jgi:hypothetical protein
MWLGPFADFPREMGYPARSGIVYSMKEFLEKINLHNQKTNVFTTLYSFDSINSNGKPDYDSTRIEHIFFDLDNGNANENIFKLHNYLLDKDLFHTIFFSGGGFHCYIACIYPNFLKNKKAAIFNAVTDISDKNGFKIGINEHSDIDAHTIGNIAQLVRVPNTFNLKRKLFCIPILDDDLFENMEYIKEKAKKQSNLFTVYGHHYLDLMPYDRESVERYKIPSIEMGDSSNGIENIDVEKFHPCVKALLTKRLIKHRERYIVITYCKEIGLPIKDTILLLKKHLEPRVLNHCVFEEHQPMFIYRRADLGFPSCEKLRQEGLCVEKEGNRCNLRT